MNWDQIEGKWDQVKGQVKEQWGKFSDNDIVAIRGKKEQLLGKIQEKYGYNKQRATKEMEAFIKKCSCAPQSSAKN